MKFSTREDIDAPIDQVFGKVSDFAQFERTLTRRGVVIVHDETHARNQVGAAWNAKFNWRGRRQNIDAKLISIESGHGFAIESKSNGVLATSVIDLVALSKQHTRMFVSLDLKPTTLSSRLLIQSLRLTKSRLNKRFKIRVGEFARGLVS